MLTGSNWYNSPRNHKINDTFRDPNVSERSMLAFAGVFHPKVDPSHAPRKRPIPPNAVLFEVKVVTQPRFESAIGAIKPIHEADVASKILARVLELNVTAGKAVSTGDVLVRLSNEEQQSRVRQAEADRDAM